MRPAPPRMASFMGSPLLDEAELGEAVAEDGGAVGVGLAEGKAVDGADLAHHGEGGLDGDGVGVAEEVAEERIPRLVEGAGTGEVALEGEADHLGHLGGDDVRGDGDDALGADGNHGEGKGVVAGENGEVGGNLADGGDAVDATAGFLDGADVGVLGEALDDGEGNLLGGAAGHVVEHDGDAEVGDGGEVAVEALGVGLVVVRGDLKGGVDAEADDFLGEEDGLFGGVGAGAGDDLGLAGDGLDGGLDDLKVVGGAEGGTFASGADGADAGNALFELPLDEGAERAVVNGTVVVEGGDEGGVDTFERDHGECSFWGRV